MPESNWRPIVGNDLSYHYTNPARFCSQNLFSASEVFSLCSSDFCLPDNVLDAFSRTSSRFIALLLLIACLCFVERALPFFDSEILNFVS